MKIRHRALSLLLTLAMVLTFMPALAFADAGDYTATFDANGGYFYEDPDMTEYDVTCDEDDSVMFPSDPENGNKIFLGWTEVKDGDTILEEPYVLTGDKTFYAKWQDPFKATFDAGAGHFPESGNPSTKVVEADIYGDVSAPIEPVRDGYKFIGWTREPQGEEPTYDYYIEEDTTFYAIWVLTATFDANGGYFDEEGQPTTAEHDSFLEDGNYYFYSLPPDPIKEGYVFAGWAEKGGSVLDREYFNETPMTEHKTYYAQWEAGINVTFSANGKTFKGGSTEKIRSFSKGSYIYNVPDWESTDGKVVIGWSLTAGGDAIDIDDYEVNGPVTLYAIWGGVATINLDPCEGAFLDMEAGEVREDNEVKQNEPFSYYLTESVEIGGVNKNVYPVYLWNDSSVPTLEDNAFAGWYTDSGRTDPFTKADMDALFASNGTTTLYAGYATPASSLTVNANGGYFGGDSETSSFDVVYPSGWALDMDSVSPEKDSDDKEYELAGWYYDEDCTEPVNLTDDRYFIPDGNTIYAKWQEAIDEGDFELEFDMDEDEIYSDGTEYDITAAFDSYSDREYDVSYKFRLTIYSHKGTESTDDDNEEVLATEPGKYFTANGNVCTINPAAITEGFTDEDFENKDIRVYCTVTDNDSGRDLITDYFACPFTQPEANYAFDEDWLKGRQEILFSSDEEESSLSIEMDRVGHFWNADNPEGEDFDYEVTSVTVSDPANFKVKKEDWGEYCITPLHPGETEVTITYTTYDGDEDTITFTFASVTELYTVTVEPMDDNGGYMLIGSTLGLKATGTRENEKGSFNDGFTFDWSSNHPEYVDIAVDDPASGRADVTVSPDFADANTDMVTITVSILDGEGKVRNYESIELNPRTEFYTITNLPKVDRYLRPGKEISFSPKLIRHSMDIETSDHSEEVQKCAFGVDFDEEAIRVTNSKNKVLMCEDPTSAPFKVKRLKDWYSSFEIVGYIPNDDPDYDEEYDDPYEDVCRADEFEFEELININTSNFKITGVKNVSYNKKAYKPAVKLYEKYDSWGLVGRGDYSVSYGKNTNVGWGTVSVTGKGEYYGTKTAKFRINPKGTSLKKLTKGKKSFTVTWTKQAVQTTGYQIQYSLYKNFKGAKTLTVKKNSTTKATIKKLKAKKNYYVRIRTYKKIGKDTFTSGWSKVKVIKTK